MGRRWIRHIFFSNYFYGICAVALSVEATLQQRLPLNSVHYYLFVFAITVLYYTRAYISGKSKEGKNSGDARSAWYRNHRNFVRGSQVALTIAVVPYLFHLLAKRPAHLSQLSPTQWLLLGIFPLAAMLYYGINHPRTAAYRLRNIGWLKPFVIGFVWAGVVTVYPVLFYAWENDPGLLPDRVGLYLFIKNFMFISVLSIMFDIKDYASDHNQDLKTFVVKAGLRKTIFYILIPLSLAGLTSFIYYALIRHFSTFKILLNTIPFLLMITVAYSMHRRKPILYYLIVIDGLMLVKAAAGSLAMWYF